MWYTDMKKKNSHRPCQCVTSTQVAHMRMTWHTNHVNMSHPTTSVTQYIDTMCWHKMTWLDVTCGHMMSTYWHIVCVAPHRWAGSDTVHLGDTQGHANTSASLRHALQPSDCPSRQAEILKSLLATVNTCDVTQKPSVRADLSEWEVICQLTCQNEKSNVNICDVKSYVTSIFNSLKIMIETLLLSWCDIFFTKSHPEAVPGLNIRSRSTRRSIERADVSECLADHSCRTRLQCKV